MTRFHKKADGILMIADDGHARFLTAVERLLLSIGLKPRDARSSTPSTQDHRGFIVILWVAASICFAIGISAALSGCGHYEPPGRDLWRAL